MLKRKDLAKEFDLIVRQEIENHNRSILATNVSINGFTEELAFIKSKLAEITARMNSRYVKLENEIRSISDRILEKIHKQEVFSDNISNDNRMNSAFLDRKIDEFQEGFIEKSVFLETIDKMSQEVNTCGIELRHQKDVMFASISQLDAAFKDTFSRFKYDLMNRPNELWEVKKELEKKIDVANVNAEGILKELLVYKKSMFIIEKKIEDLYNLLNRLKKGHRDGKIEKSI